MSALWLVPIAAGFAVIWCHWVGALNRVERLEADLELARAVDLAWPQPVVEQDAVVLGRPWGGAS